jgi:hypothetical protein
MLGTWEKLHELRHHHTCSPMVIAIGRFLSCHFFLLLVVLFVSALQDRQYLRQQAVLQNYVFAQSYFDEVKTRYQHLTEAEVRVAFEQLRLYLTICWKKKPRTVVMPSKLVDTCWHIFITDTRCYQQFCDDVFGRFLHHEPRVEVCLPLEVEAKDAEVAKAESKETKEQRLTIKRHELDAARVYQWAVMQQEQIVLNNKFLSEQSMDKPVPLLFSVDKDMRIPDGYFYSSEVIWFLATYDIKAAEAAAASLDSSAAGNLGAACGDGRVTCGGCGGST